MDKVSIQQLKNLLRTQGKTDKEIEEIISVMVNDDGIKLTDEQKQSILMNDSLPGFDGLSVEKTEKTTSKKLNIKNGIFKLTDRTEEQQGMNSSH